MQVNNISFGSTFRFNPRRIKGLGDNNRHKLGLLLRRYTGVDESQLHDLFSGKTTTLSVNNTVDKMLEGFCKAFHVKTEKI